MLFLWNAAGLLYKKTISNDYIDTLTLARYCLPGLSHYKLVDVASYYQISTEGAHRALNDCIMNQQCYERLGAEYKNMPQQLCPMCGELLVRRNGRYGAFWGCSGYPNCKYTRNAD